MAFSTKLPLLSLLLFCVVLMDIVTQPTLAVRPLLPAANTRENEQITKANPSDKNTDEANPGKKQHEANSNQKPSETTNPSSKNTDEAKPGKKQHEANSNQKQSETTNPGNKNQAEKNPDKKQTECVGHEGTVLIPGVGRYMFGTIPPVPTLGRTYLGDSVPAAMNGRYVPGFDDTFVPNPGFEVPNPARGAVP